MNIYIEVYHKMDLGFEEKDHEVSFLVRRVTAEETKSLRKEASPLQIVQDNSMYMHEGKPGGVSITKRKDVTTYN